MGETQQFVATVKNVDGEVMSRNVQWSSSDEAVATIDNTGLATGVALGESTIEATSGKVSESAVLTVKDGDAHPEIVAETITGGTWHSCGLSAAGMAYCWGDKVMASSGMHPTPTARSLWPSKCPTA